MWNNFWQWFYDNHIFHTILIAAVLYLVFFPEKLHRALGKFRKIKAGPIELQAGEEIDPNAPCPYKKSRDISFNTIRSVESKVDRLEEKVNILSGEMRKEIEIVTNMSIDYQKSYFYDQRQPDVERLAAGLKYIHLGGNGFTKADVIAFSKQHKSEYSALTRAKPEWRLIYDKQEGL